MKVFEVEITYTVLVQAENESAAYYTAEDELREIAFNDEPSVFVMGEIKSLAGLPSGWEPDCCAYGGGELLSDLLPQEAPIDGVERDTKTIDMFGKEAA
jgi:hypothetical protein